MKSKINLKQTAANKAAIARYQRFVEITPRVQRVSLGRVSHTQQAGFFTNGWLAMSLTEEQYAIYAANSDAARAHAERCGFEFVASN
jgi:hypothetical protein